MTTPLSNREYYKKLREEILFLIDPHGEEAKHPDVLERRAQEICDELEVGGDYPLQEALEAVDRLEADRVEDALYRADTLAKRITYARASMEALEKELAAVKAEAGQGPGRWVYIRAEVAPTDPERVALWNALTTGAGSAPAPEDVPTDPGVISFKHAFLMADNSDDAYTKGWDLLPRPTPGTVINDYVVPVTDDAFANPKQP